MVVPFDEVAAVTTSTSTKVLVSASESTINGLLALSGWFLSLSWPACA